jgi:DNA-binding CsgD family transcriptional regulator
MVQSGLLGRDEPLAALVEAIESGRPALVSGEAGIGKTALVRAAVSASGRSVREGGGFATLSWLPYLALRRATGVPDLGSPAAVAARVERELGRDVLFLDDLQWLDPPSWSVVRALLGRVRFVGAVRLGDPGCAAAIAQVQHSDARVIPLGGLEPGPSFEIAARTRPDRPAADLARIVDESGGNPLLIEELALHDRRPHYLDRAIVAQLDDLPPPARDVLALHALRARPIADAEHSGAATAAAGDLVERGLLRVGPDGREVRHRIIATAVLHAIDDQTRSALMREAATITGAHARNAARDRQLRDLERSIDAGELHTAISVADALLEQPLARRARLRVLCRRAVALALLGRFDEANRDLGAAEALATQEPACRLELAAAAAETAWWEGRPALAIALAEHCLAPDGGSAAGWRAALTRAWSLVDLGREPGAVAADERMPWPAAALAEHRGLAARAAGEHRRAAAAFGAAAAAWSGVNLARELLCSWAAADAWRLAGDAEDAIGRLQGVLERVVAIGFEPLAARARRSIRLAGGHAPGRIASSRAGILTGREREVLALVERGLTNAEIARRLSLGRPTVARLLSNAMQRLGAESRVHAVMLASTTS